MIVTLRTTVGRENAVIETLSNRARNMGTDVRAVFHPEELKGYLFVEGNIESIEKTAAGIPHIRGIIRKEVALADIKRFLETKRTEIKINKGDIVEVMGGPFKNERGRVTRVDESKEEVTIEMLEAAIPIPISVPLDSVRLIESFEKGGKSGESKS
ncbi:MAG: transcription elongation factor Spt5 [Candidatus Aenigmarchaeota archaeon]|nr:transcription elongation factor Spt5 [Candidatus Aenigmarchaeota archaeon]